MSLFKKIFGKKEEPIETYSDFWAWFQSRERTFFKAVKSGQDIEELFFNQLSPKLDELMEGYYFLTGMEDAHTAELILTPDGTIKNIVFVEELVQAAPNIPNWKFTALKPELNIEDVNIGMADYTFNKDNLFFYGNEEEEYPDEVDLVIVHDDYKEEDKSTIVNGTYIFLDNYLGELKAATAIDYLKVISKEEAEKELIPIAKLKDFLTWREKEFVEKYSGLRQHTDKDSYACLEAKGKSGMPWIIIINSALLNWDAKASHPWILEIGIDYDGTETNGMPSEAEFALFDQFENDILSELKDVEGYLNVGRKTAENNRTIYFACKDFRKPSKVLFSLSKEYDGRMNLTYDIYKDKYWRSLEKCNV